MDFKDQLIMRNSHLADVPDLKIPEGYRVHTEEEGSKEIWKDIVKSSFDFDEEYDDKTNRPGWTPERMFFVEIDGKDVATATSYDHWDYPGEGFLHMVGTRKDCLGKGAGSLVTLAVLNWLKQNGYKSAVLSTDDWRLPALKMYYKLGFRPVNNREDMPARWAEVYKNLGIEDEVEWA